MLRLDVLRGVKGDRVERESSDVLNILSSLVNFRQPFFSNNVQNLNPAHFRLFRDQSKLEFSHSFFLGGGRQDSGRLC